MSVLLEQLDPDAVGILDVDLRVRGVLGPHGHVDAHPHEFAVRPLDVGHDEGQMVQLLAQMVGRVEPALLSVTS